jgi:hypothetical protein
MSGAAFPEQYSQEDWRFWLLRNVPGVGQVIAWYQFPTSANSPVRRYCCTGARVRPVLDLNFAVKFGYSLRKYGMADRKQG